MTRHFLDAHFMSILCSDKVGFRKSSKMKFVKVIFWNSNIFPCHRLSIKLLRKFCKKEAQVKNLNRVLFSYCKYAEIGWMELHQLMQ